MVKKSEISKYLAELGGKGGKAGVKNPTAEQRKASARKAAQARWARARSENSPSKQQRDRNERKQ
jgi:hypothetical protein